MKKLEFSVPINHYETVKTFNSMINTVNEIDRTTVELSREELQQLIDSVVIAVETKDLYDLEVLACDLLIYSND